MRRLLAVLALLAGGFAFAPSARADEEPTPASAAPHAAPAGHGDHAAPAGHAAPVGHADHAAPVGHADHAEPAHAEHGADHPISLDDFNWYHGLIAEKEGAEPGLWFRPKGMPVPFAALLLDSLILYYILYRALGKSVRDGLKKRKETILRGMEEAAKMRREAEAQLAHYEEKLAQISGEVVRLKQQMRHAAESESARILAEAKDRRVRMEQDAQQLVEQELKATRERLMAELLDNALKSAEDRLKKRIGESEQLGFADEFVRSLPAAAAALRGRV
jgi:F0F1-type ATP synthase membrane subunit b/b'